MKEEDIQKNGDKIFKKAIVNITTFYGMLMLLMAVLTNEDKLSFWLLGLSAVVLIEALQLIAKTISLGTFGKFTNFFNYLSFSIVEIGTIMICTIFGLLFLDFIKESIYGDSKFILLTSAFMIILILYESILWFRNYLNEKYNFQKEYCEFKRAFEDKYNMVNLLTILATILTFMVLASGIEKESSDIAIEFFLSCSVVYVLLIHYCGKYRLNEKVVNDKNC